MRGTIRRLGSDGLTRRAALGRIGGQTVGIVASQPRFEGGVLTPKACDKATRLLCLCDAFGIPVVFLLDTPGFLVGTDVEHDGLVPKAVLFQQALAHLAVPKLTVVLRKAFGLAFFSLAGSPDVAATMNATIAHVCGTAAVKTTTP